MTKLLLGNPVLANINQQSSAQAALLAKRGIRPTLAILRVGQRPDEIAYERGAIKRCLDVGVATQQVTLPQSAQTADLLQTIQTLNANNDIHGVLVLRPLPPQIDDDAVRNSLAANKDIDGIGDASVAGVFTGENLGFTPCTPQACMEVLDHYNIKLAGQKAVVVGRSLVVGKPLALKLLERNATVTICHSHSLDLPAICRAADIIIACAGRPSMLGADCFSSGQTVIDVGININAEGKLTGDVDFAAASQIVAAITPVPGGVGPVTTSVLVKHVVQAATVQA